MTLTEFLLARIAEDEEAALDIANDWPLAIAKHLWDSCQPDAEGPPNFVNPLREAGWDDVHDMRYDIWKTVQTMHYNPARTMAECKAKRRIVQREEVALLAQWRKTSAEHMQTWEQWMEAKGPNEMLTLRDLVSVYVDHPDFLEIWR